MNRLTNNVLFVATGLWLLACGAGSPADAERNGNVEWLEKAGTPEAVSALGRLADKKPAAAAALERRSSYDGNALIAAWQAHTRNAPWGTQLLRSALIDPARAELAARAMVRKDPALAVFAPELEQAVQRLASGSRGAVVAGVLASIGPSARPMVERRLVDAKTRGPMCEGIGHPESANDAKTALLSVPVEARDHEACINAVMQLAVADDSVLGWLGTAAEPGLLGAAGKSDLPCPRLLLTWQKALESRPKESFSALTISLSRAIKRCPAVFDPTLAALVEGSAESRSCVVMAIDPFGGETTELPKTCAMLGKVSVDAREAHKVRERAADASNHACRNVRK